MKFHSAEFTFTDKNKAVEISFRPGEVAVSVEGKEIWKQENKAGDRGGTPWKPCVTHCEEIYRRATYKPPATQFARNRAKDLKPKLELFKGEK